MSRAIKAPATLPELVTTAFSKARADGELLYFPTRVALLPVPMPFQLRFSPAFADKPKKPKTSSPPTDPFANPPASLYVGSVGPGHYVVLNKFAIVAEHFILATNEFQKQTELLALADLEATMACVRAYKQTKRGLFAFFNSGEHSGASQPHRHIQLLPVERMRDGLPEDQSVNGEESSWEPLTARQSLLDAAPFATFAEDTGPEAAPAQVHASYLRLYEQACRALGVDADGQIDGEARISYNLALTTDRLVVCPRRAEGDEDGTVALNGTVLAGTALVKSEGDWEALRGDPGRLSSVLQGIGVPRLG